MSAALSLSEGSAAPRSLVTERVSAMLRHPAYGALPDDEKPHVKARLSMCERIEGATNKAAAIRAEAGRLHYGESLTESGVRKLYYKWVGAARDWQPLVNRARVPDRERTIAEETITHWHELCARFGGKMAAAHRELRRQWHYGHEIPGLPRDNRPADLPPSLSYSNLTRKPYRPTDVARAVSLVGPSAAADLLPGVLSTRVGLAPGSRWVFDDMWHDFKVTVPGQVGARRLLQFHGLELLSGHLAARGIKPELLNADTGRMQRLNEREFLFVLAHTLGTFGYNPEGCVLMMEHGTANVHGAFESILHEASHGKISIDRGGIKNHALAEGLYAGRGHGNFKFKAALESLGNLIHNETHDRLLLPAQTGSNMRLNAPDELHGRERHLDQLQRCALLLPSHLREIVTAEITPPLAKALNLVEAIQERINDRTDHDLEGWEQLGFTRALYRLTPDQPWRPQAELREMAEGVRAAICAAIEANPRLASCRLMSPREVFEERVRPVLTRLPAHLCIQLIGMEHAKERRVGKDGRFHFDDMDLGPGEHHYEGIVRAEDGATATLPDGEKFATFVSMLDPLRMHLCDAKGRYLGWVDRTLVHTRGDAEGFARAAGKAQAAARERLAPAVAAARPLIQRDLAATEQANQVLADAAALAVQEKATARAKAQPKGEAAARLRNRAAQMAAAAAQRLAEA